MDLPESRSLATALACDFAHVDCAVTLERVCVFFVIEFETRYALVLGATANPDGAWTAQAGRNLPLDLGEWAEEFRVLLRDRGGRSTDAFDYIVAGTGSRWSSLRRAVRVRTRTRSGGSAPRAPNLAIAC